MGSAGSLRGDSEFFTELLPQSDKQLASSEYAAGAEQLLWGLSEYSYEGLSWSRQLYGIPSGQKLEVAVECNVTALGRIDWSDGG